MSTVKRPRDEALGIQEILRQLRQGPQQIAAMTAGLSSADLRKRPTSDEWSINENLAHLRASADVWGRYLARIVAEDNPTFSTLR